MPVKRTPACSACPAKAPHALSLTELAFLDRPIELALQSLGERLIVMRVDALAVGREHRIEKAQEHLRVGVVVRGDGALVGIDLPEQHRLDEAPGGHQRMTVVEGGTERERLQHVAFNINIALEIGLGDVALIERAQRLDGALVAEANAKFFLAQPDLALLPARQLDREGCRKTAQAIEKEIERGCG